jgi:hypothetical protein
LTEYAGDGADYAPLLIDPSNYFRVDTAWTKPLRMAQFKRLRLKTITREIK